MAHCEFTSACSGNSGAQFFNQPGVAFYHTYVLVHNTRLFIWCLRNVAAFVVNVAWLNIFSSVTQDDSCIAWIRVNRKTSHTCTIVVLKSIRKLSVTKQYVLTTKKIWQNHMNILKNQKGCYILLVLTHIFYCVMLSWSLLFQYKSTSSQAVLFRTVPLHLALIKTLSSETREDYAAFKKLGN